MELTKLIKSANNTKRPAESFCNIKKYIKTEDKIRLINEIANVCEEHKNDYPVNNGIVFYVFTHLLIIKYYTDIEFDMSYDSFDLLQENGLMGNIIEEIGNDYDLLKVFIKL